MTLLYLASPEPLEIVAPRVMKALRAETSEERDSDNYPGGNYYTGTAGAIEIVVNREYDDDPFYPVFQFLVAINPPESMSDTPDAEIARMAAPELLRAGLRAADALEGTDELTRWRVFQLMADGSVDSTLLELPIPA